MKPLVAGLRQRTTVDCDQASDYNVRNREIDIRVLKTLAGR